MIRHPFRPFPTRVRHDQLLVTSALALALTALPIGIEAGAPGLQWQTAIAKKRWRRWQWRGRRWQAAVAARRRTAMVTASAAGAMAAGSRDHAHGRDDSPWRSGGARAGLSRRRRVPGQRPQRQGARAGTAGRAGRSGERALCGGARQGEQARQPATDAAGPGRPSLLGGRDQGADGARLAAGRPRGAARLPQPWRAGRTMVELSKRLGYGARVGALQANFGTPQENRITALQAELARGRGGRRSGRGGTSGERARRGDREGQARQRARRLLGDRRSRRQR